MNVTVLSLGYLGTNCYLLEGTDGCLVIDPAGEPDRVLAALGDRKLVAILLTHGHFDHIGGVEALARDGAEIVVHQADAPMLQSTELNVSWLAGMHVTAPEATCTVREGDVITHAGVTFTVLHTPGHTPGCVCYRAGEWLFTGDTLFHFGYGRTDLPGGSVHQLAESLRRLQPLAQQYEIYPGH